MRCYNYGAKRGPSGGADLVEAQIQRAHRYYNVLVEIERARRAAVRAAGEAAVAIAAANAQARARTREERARCGCYWGCVDSATEILTFAGWKSHLEFAGTEVVATYNLNTQAMEWQEAAGKVEYPYKGNMIRVKTGRLDMLLTPNHRVVVVNMDKRRRADGIVGIRLAEDLPARAPRLKVPQAARGLEPSDPLSISAPLASVLGWVLAEGYFNNRNGVSISQSHRVNKPYCDEIRAALLATHLSFTETQDRFGMTCFCVSSRDGSATAIRRWIPEKRLTAALATRLTKPAAEALWLALLHGDGARGDTSSGKERWRWVQVDEQNVAMFQVLGQRLGIATTAIARPGIWTVGVRRQPYGLWQSQLGPVATPETYDGIVWCPQTPNTTWVARRNGRTFITGNSYLIAEDAAGRAARTPGDGPRFRPWTGEGQIAVQLQGGLAVADLLAGADTRVRVLGAGKHRDLWMRVGSDGRAPVWAVVPFVYHRDIPSDALVKWVRLSRRKVATHYEYSVQFVVDEPAPGPRTGDMSAQPSMVAVDVGWRRVEGGMRVATWVDSADDHGEVLIPDAMLARWKKCEDLASIRRKNFTATLALLVDARRGSDPRWPAWLVEETEHAYQWLATGRLAALVVRWRAQRWAGDDVLFTALETWRKQDKHLYEWETHQRQNILRARREVYRIFAAQTAARYQVVVVEKLDLRAFAEKPETAKEDDPRTAAARPRRFQAALSELLGAMANAADRAGRDWRELDPANTTLTCSACRSLERFDAGAELVHTCSACGATYDQDENACRNLLRAALSGEITSGRSRGKRTGESESQKRRREGKARQTAERSQAAT